MKRKLRFSIPMLFALVLFLSIDALGQSEQIHYFNFNENTPSSNTSWEQPIAATIGSGELTYTFTEAYSFGGTTVNGNPGEVNGGSFVPRGGADMVNNGEHFILSLPTTGYGNIVLTYATQRTNTGFDTQTVEYTTNGIEWTEIIIIDNIPSSFGLRTVDFSSVTEANDNDDFAVRFVLTGASAPAGNNRFDNISVSGTPFGFAIAPTFSPNGGTFFAPVEVTIETETEDAEIFYSFDSGDPESGDWNEYEGAPITVDQTTTIWAYATAAGLDPSGVSSAEFVFPEVVEVADIASLRAAGAKDVTIYKLTGEAYLTFQQDFRNQKYIQDETAGILIDDAPAGNFNPGIISTGYDIYDGITGIIGTLNTFGNMVQFVPLTDPGAPTSVGNIVEPLEVTLADFNENFMDYQSRLITILDVYFGEPDRASFANGQTYTITDGVETALFRTTFFGVDYINTPVPEGNWNITGLPNSRSDGDFITARNLADFEELGEEPPPLPLDIIFNQPYHDGGNAATSALDVDNDIDYEVADNFFGLEDAIEEFVFYGITLYNDGFDWQELTPGDTEPFFIRFYEYEAEVIAAELVAPVSGEYQVALIDDYGDGWNGGILTVYVNGIPVLSDITLPSGAGPVYHSFQAEQGDEISTLYTPGSWAYENYYAILDPDEIIIAEQGGTWNSPGASVPGNINPGGETPYEPEWENPYAEYYVDAEVSVAGSWGQYVLYKFTALLDAPVDLEQGWVSAQIDTKNGSGTWFLWVNSLAGDGLSWQRLPDDTKSFSRELPDLTAFSQKGNVHASRDQLTYDMAFALLGGEFTDPPQCAEAISPADQADGVEIDGMLSWTDLLLADGYLLYFGEAGAGWNIVDGEDLGNNTVYEYTGLDFETEYEWMVVPYNVNGEAEDCPVWSFTTMDDLLQTLPWSEDFTGIAQGVIPVNWDRTHTNWGVNASSNAGGTSPEMRFNWSPSATATFRLATPPLDGTTQADYQLVFKHYINYFDTPAIYKVQSSTDETTWNDEWAVVDPTGNVGPETVIIPLDHLSGEVFYLAWVYEGNSFNTDGWFIDDIFVEEIPDCPAPTALTATNINATSADIGWIPGGDETEWDVLYGTEGFNPETEGELLESLTENPYTLEGLLPETDYAIYVRAVCNTEVSDWAGPFAFTTLCLPVEAFPWIETFENDSDTRDCWSQIQEVGAGDWTFAAGSSGGAITSAYEGTLNARFVSLSPSAGNTPITKLVTPLLNISNLDNPFVDFWYGQEVWFGDQNELKVYYRTGVEEPWVEIAHFDENTPVWTNASLELPEKSATYQIAFEGINNWGRANVLDFVTVYDSICEEIEEDLIVEEDVDIYISGPFLCLDYKQVRVFGELNINDVKLNVHIDEDYNPAAGEEFVIFTYGVLDGKFSNLNLFKSVCGKVTFIMSYGDDAKNNDNQIVLTVVRSAFETIFQGPDAPVITPE